MKKLILVTALSLMALFLASCSEEKGMSILVIESIDSATEPFGDIMTNDGGVMTDIVDVNFLAQLKNQTLTNTNYTDVIIEKLVISFTRLDGGTDTPTSFEYFNTLRVPGGGSAKMAGVPILSATKKLELPLSELYDFGYERSTSFDTIKLRVNIEAVGKSIDGSPIYARGSISMEITNWAD
jgi:hypothetical protein